MKVLTPAETLAPNSSPAAGEAIIGGRALSIGQQCRAYLELTKPRITFLIVLSALAGFCLGAEGKVDYLRLLHTALGIALLSSGIATLNQYLERDLDALMRRTRLRPLPLGKLSPGSALWFGVAISAIAELYLALLVNPLTALWGLAALASYLFGYTPLKTRTTWCTFIGAFPGALPPLLGWTAARNEVGIEALVLFAILFLWQFPHFHAIASLYREDYVRAGIRMLPAVEADGRSTARQIVGYTAALLPVSLLPTWFHLSGLTYLAGALILGSLFLYAGLRAARLKTKAESRRLLQASVLYLPLLFILMVLNQ